MKKVLVTGGERDAIKLVSVNIEQAKHLDSVRAFLEKEKPDIACLQEVYEEDLEELGKALGMKTLFGQMNLMGRVTQTEPPFLPYGIGMFSLLPMENARRSYYRGSREAAEEHVFNGSSQDSCHLLLYASIKKGESVFLICSTHFTWAPNGEANEYQRDDLQSLLGILKTIPEIVLCGDFNAPRGKEIFDTLAKYYKDNIPLQYMTSIDMALHRDANNMQGKPLMVDGLFTTPSYQCSNVRLQDGISDHMAIVAEIQRV